MPPPLVKNKERSRNKNGSWRKKRSDSKKISDYVVTNAYFDGTFIVNLVCPICNKNNEAMIDFEEGELLELKCGHKFKMKKLIKELHVSGVA